MRESSLNTGLSITLDHYTGANDSLVLYNVRNFAPVNHEEITFDGVPRNYNISTNYGLAIFLTLEFFVYSYLMFRAGKNYLTHFRSIFNRNRKYDKSSSSIQESWMFQIFTVINLGILSFLFIEHEATLSTFPYYDFFACLGCVAIFFVLRLFISQMVAYTFFQRAQTQEVQSDILVEFSLLGALLFPVVLVMLYSPDFAYNYALAGGILISVCYIVMKIYNIIGIFCTRISSFFYLFLYLCAIEFLTIVLLLVCLFLIEK